MRLHSLIPFVLAGLIHFAHAGDAVAKPYPPVIRGTNVSIDSLLNRYVTGTFTGTVDLNPAKGSDIRGIGDAAASFFVRFNNDNSYNWGQTFGASQDETGEPASATNSIVFATDSVIYAIVTFRMANGGFEGTGSVTTRGASDIAILAMDAATGAPITSFGGDGIVQFGGTGSESAGGIYVSGGTVYVCGGFSGTASIDNNPGVTAAGFSDLYVLALDAVTGAPKPSFGINGIQTLGDTNASPTVNSITVSGSRVFVSGTFSGTTLSPSAGGVDGFVLAMDSATGAFDTMFGGDGIVSFGGSDSDGVGSVAVANNILYFGGDFKSTDAGIDGLGSVSSSGIFDAYVVALDAASGAPIASFGTNGVVRYGGFDGSEVFEFLRYADNVLYCAGYGSSTNPDINGTFLNYTRQGFFDGHIVALNAFTGQPANSFGNGDAVLSFGGSEFATKNSSLPGTFTFTNGFEVGGGKIFWSGSFTAKNATLDNQGAEFDATGFGGFLHVIDTVFDEKPPLVADPNPTRPGRTVTFTATGPVAGAPITWDFGDGSPFGGGNPTTHVYGGSVDTTFTVTATSANGQLTVPVLMVVPNVPLQLNVGNGVTVMEPLNGLSLSLDTSEGGILEFLTDPTTLRANEDVFTKVTEGDDFIITPSRRAIFKAKNSGIAVATTIAKNGPNIRGKARKMVAVSAREVGESNALPAAPDKNVVVGSLAGKFLFTSEKADAVKFKGTVQLPTGFDLSSTASHSLAIGIGNVTDTVGLDAKGRGGASTNLVIKKASVKFPKLKDATVAAGGEAATLQIQFSLANLDARGFDTEGIVAQLRAEEAGMKSVPRTIQIAIVLGGVSYEAQASVDYKLSSKGTSGSIKNTRVAR
jgi:hypothetical protein